MQPSTLKILGAFTILIQSIEMLSPRPGSTSGDVAVAADSTIGCTRSCTACPENCSHIGA